MFEQQNHHETQWAAIRSIAEKSGMSAETVRKWVRQAERDEGRRPGLSTDERDRLSKLEKENKELKRANKDLEGCFGFLRGGARPPTDQMIDFIDHNRARWGVEPICRVLPIASSTYYAAKKRPTAMRTLRDEDLKVEIWRVWDENFRVYGARKIWIALNREGIRVARCTVAPLDAPARHQGRCRRKAYRTTWPHEEATERSRDLVERAFNASAPNRLWVADVTYARTLSGVAYVCLIIDCFARMIVGWHLSRSLKTELCLDALEHAIWARGERNLGGLIHHSDRGVQFLSIRYTERVAEIGAVTSVGSRGDSFDNALAESVIGLYKTEYARNGGVPRGFDDLELRTLEWIDWWNHRRLLEPIGDVPPAEAEAVFYSQGAPVTGTGTQGTEFL